MVEPGPGEGAEGWGLGGSRGRGERRRADRKVCIRSAGGSRLESYAPPPTSASPPLPTMPIHAFTLRIATRNLHLKELASTI